MLPPVLIEHAKLDREVVVVGMRDESRSGTAPRGARR